MERPTNVEKKKPLGNGPSRGGRTAKNKNSAYRKLPEGQGEELRGFKPERGPKSKTIQTVRELRAGGSPA